MTDQDKGKEVREWTTYDKRGKIYKVTKRKSKTTDECITILSNY